MAGGNRAVDTQKIIAISKARRLHYSERPSIDPPCAVGSFTSKMPEADRAILAEAEIRSDITVGDPGLTALRKCRYILEHADLAIADLSIRERLVARTVAVIAEYGEPEGLPLVRGALALYGSMRTVREAASEALSQIGGERELDAIVPLVAADIAAPERHLRAIILLAERFPEIAARAAESLRAFDGSEAVASAISELIPHGGRSA